jgi:hypothetical protein
MAFTKYASLENAQVLEIKGSQERIKTATLDKFAEFDDFRTEDGYLYARIRAISSRVNKNHDGWPSVELAGGEDAFQRLSSEARTANFTAAADKAAQYGYSTFLGKPIFVDHHNTDPSRARGVIVDAKIHIEDHRTAGLDSYYSSAPENHMPPTWVELVLEVDAKSFPKLAKAIIEGSKDNTRGIDGFSMGCDVERSICNICKNSASTPEDYCEHVQMKGAEFPWVNPKTGHKESRKSYEDCYGIKFFEISAVFDPADETALLRDLIHKEGAVDVHMPCPTCDGNGSNQYGDVCPECNGAGEYPVQGGDGAFAPSQLQSGDIPYNAGDDVYQTMLDRGLPHHQHQGKKAHIKTAENPEPQADLLKAPKAIDTLRKESICPVCGSDMDEDTCEVCGYQRPPEGMDNPDLSKARKLVDQEQDQENQQPEEQPEDDFTGESTSNQATFAHVTNDMEWKVSVPARTAGYTNPDQETPVVPGPGASQDEPKGEVTVTDPTTPVTSNVRTAQDFIAAAGARETRRTMSDHKTADAASGAPEVATPDVNVDTDAKGGVMEATNEEASKADAQVDVLGEGGTGVEGVSADSTESVDQGDEHSKNIEEIPTKTFDDGSSKVERQGDPVSSEPFPASEDGVKASSWQVEATDDKAYPEDDGGLAGGNAVEGVQPADPVGVPDDRVDVLDHVTSPGNNSGPTKTWSGTDGNGVLQQQEPVTDDTLEGADIVNIKGSSTHVFAAFKLADLEVELGLIDPSTKYSRVAELEQKSPEQLSEALAYAGRVKTAGLSKQGQKTARRMPVMGRNAATTKEASQEPTQTSQDVNDSALFL